MGLIPKWLWDQEVAKAKKAEDEAAALRAKEAADHKAWLRANAESVIVPEHPAVALLREVEWSGEDNVCPACGEYGPHSTLGGGLTPGVHRADCRLAAILASKPGDRVLAELLAEAHERGRQEAEVEASRKAAEQFRAMHTEAVAAIAKAREEGAASPTLLPLGVPGGEWREALHERIADLLAERSDIKGSWIPLVATQILRAVDDALQAQRTAKGGS